jgi:hypothetical protein
MEKELRAKEVPITEDTTLHEWDLITCLQQVGGKSVQIVWRMLSARQDGNEEMIEIQEMSRDGVAIKEDKRIRIWVPLEYLIENEFCLLQDKSYDEMDWPRTLDRAVSKLKSQFDQNQLLEVRQMSQDDFLSRYLGSGVWIRNYFGLWRGNFELLLDCDESNPEPDHVSTVILKELWQSMQNK